MFESVLRCTGTLLVYSLGLKFRWWVDIREYFRVRYHDSKVVIMITMIKMMMPEYIPPTLCINFLPTEGFLAKFASRAGSGSSFCICKQGFPWGWWWCDLFACLKMRRRMMTSTLMREMKKIKELCWAVAKISDEDDVCVFLDDEHDQGFGLSPCVCKQWPAWGQQWQH